MDEVEAVFHAEFNVEKDQVRPVCLNREACLCEVVSNAHDVKSRHAIDESAQVENVLETIFDDDNIHDERGGRAREDKRPRGQMSTIGHTAVG